MRRWRKNNEVLDFENMDSDSKPTRRSSISTSYDEEDEEDEDEEDDGEDDDGDHDYSGPSFESLEPMVRAGKYKPKPEDPWTIHVLYQSLKDIGKI